MLVMAENLQTGLVWGCFMRASEVQRGMQLAGFRPNNVRDGALVRVSALRHGAVSE
jgi:hypothetical protein